MIEMISISMLLLMMIEMMMMMDTHTEWKRHTG